MARRPKIQAASRPAATVSIGLILAALGGTPVAAQPPPEVGAYELLADLERQYLEAATYSDRGSLRIDTGDDVRQLSFETARHGELFQWLVQSDDESDDDLRVLWSDAGGTFEYRSRRGEFRRWPSLVTGLASLLEHAQEAMVVPLGLAGSRAPWEEVEAAAYAGEVACAPGRCHEITVSRMAATLETTLWIDIESGWLRRVEVEHSPPGGRATLVTLEHEVLPPPSGLTIFKPPSGSREVARWREQADAAAPASGDQAPSRAPGAGRRQGPFFVEQTEVRLATFRLFLTDRRGRALPELAAGDFRITLGDHLIPVIAAEWVASPPAELSAAETAELRESGFVPPPAGRRLVLFVQSGHDGSYRYGHVRMLPRVETLLDLLGPGDQVAVVSFDSHLKLWQDFTRDWPSVLAAVESSGMRFGGRPPWRPRSRRPRAPRQPLADHLDTNQARDAATAEEALHLVAEAMAQLPGRKAMIFLGWGLGELSPGGFRMLPAYDRALEALERAETSVFVLDVTPAAAHTLELGLQRVAADTGGAYFRTGEFPDAAVKRLATALRGHYLLTVDLDLVEAAAGDDRHPALRIELESADIEPIEVPITPRSTR